MTSFATGLATPSVTDVRTDVLQCLIYKDSGVLKDIKTQNKNVFYISCVICSFETLSEGATTDLSDIL